MATKFKKVLKKVFFSLNGKACSTTPPLNGLAMKKITFFAASLRDDIKKEVINKVGTLRKRKGVENVKPFSGI